MAASGGGPARGSGPKEVVYLRLYDLSDGRASRWSPVLLGKHIEAVFHSSLLLYGMEYFYGGGIVKMKPGDVEASYNIRPFREHILGETTLTQREFEKYLISIKSNFTRELYDLIDWNCNHFTDHAARFLLNRGIPVYILDVPKEITNTFMGKIIVNFIKMFSDAPAVDSEAAHHPKQTLNASLTRTSARAGSAATRRNSCPGSPQSRGSGAHSAASGSRPLSTAEAVNLQALRIGGRKASNASRRGSSREAGTGDARGAAAAPAGRARQRAPSADHAHPPALRRSGSGNAPAEDAGRSTARRSRRGSVPALPLGQPHARDSSAAAVGAIAAGKHVQAQDHVTATTPPPLAAAPLTHRRPRRASAANIGVRENSPKRGLKEGGSGEFDAGDTARKFGLLLPQGVAIASLSH